MALGKLAVAIFTISTVHIKLIDIVYYSLKLWLKGKEKQKEICACLVYVVQKMSSLIIQPSNVSILC